MLTAMDRALKHMQEVRQRFLDTGVFWLVNDWTTREQTVAESAFGLIKLCRQTARDLKRPFVRVIERRYQGCYECDPQFNFTPETKHVLDAFIEGYSAAQRNPTR